MYTSSTDRFVLLCWFNDRLTFKVSRNCCDSDSMACCRFSGHKPTIASILQYSSADKPSDKQKKRKKIIRLSYEMDFDWIYLGVSSVVPNSTEDCKYVCVSTTIFMATWIKRSQKEKEKLLAFNQIILRQYMFDLGINCCEV